MKVASNILHAVAALVLLSVDVSAQDLSGIPSCATSCVTKLLSGSGCSTFDYTCICSSQSFISEISCCIIPVCSSSDLSSAITFANTLCARFGVTTLPQSAFCPSTSTSATGAAASSVSASASSISAVISSSLASVASSASAAASSEASAASSSAAAAMTTTVAGATSTAGAAAASSTGNVGSLNGVKGMGIAGAVVGAAAGVMGILL